MTTSLEGILPPILQRKKKGLIIESLEKGCSIYHNVKIIERIKYVIAFYKSDAQKSTERRLNIRQKYRWCGRTKLLSRRLKTLKKRLSVALSCKRLIFSYFKQNVVVVYDNYNYIISTNMESQKWGPIWWAFIGTKHRGGEEQMGPIWWRKKKKIV